jgi:tetratricopeptide (TPR) repeat protein/peroxiredoxin
VSQSPEQFVALRPGAKYFNRWNALGSMISRGRSFSGRERHCAFLNTGGQRFADVSAATGLDLIDDGRAVALVDWDHDGDQDLWITNRTGPQVRFLRNDVEAGNHFLAVRLEGRTCNRDAIGARVEVHLEGEGPAKLTKSLYAGGGFLSQSSKWLHFGLGRRTRVSRLVVRWPGSRQAEEFGDLDADRRYKIVQGSGKAVALKAKHNSVALTPSTPVEPASTEQARIVCTFRRPLPEIEYEDFDGNHHRLATDHLTLVTLWASWCRPCVKELQEFSEHAELLRDAGLNVVALCTDQIGSSATADLSAARRLVESSGFPFQTGVATKKVLRELTVLHNQTIYRERPLPLPSSFLVDPDGRVMAIYKGRVTVTQLIEDVRLVRATGNELMAASFPFPGHSSLALFDITPIGFARAYWEGGYPDDAKKALADVLTGPTPQSDQAKRRRIQAYHLLGQIEREQKQYDRMVEAYRKALQLLPDDPSLQLALAMALSKDGRPTEAEELFRAALARAPESPQLMMIVGRVYAELGRFDRAIELYQNALEHSPESIAIRLDLAVALETNDVAAAIEQYRRVLQQDADSLNAANNLAWLYATQPNAIHRNAAESLKLARRTCEATEHQKPAFLDTLAAALAANREFSAAVTVAQEAILLARGSGQEQLTADLRARLQLYLAKKPYREPAAAKP